MANTSEFLNKEIKSLLNSLGFIKMGGYYTDETGMISVELHDNKMCFENTSNGKSVEFFDRNYRYNEEEVISYNDFVHCLFCINAISSVEFEKLAA